MKTFLRFFEKNGLLKLLASFLLLALITWLYDKTQWAGLKYLIWIPAVYIIIAFLLFFGAAIINTFKDIKK